MAKYKVFITEILSKEVEVEAKNAQEAKVIANDMYRTEEIVLTADDFVSYSVHCWESTCRIHDKK